MTSHDEVEITVDIGSDIFKGEISLELIELLWPGITPQQLVDGLKTMIYDALLKRAIQLLSSGASAEAVEKINSGLNWVD